MDRPHMGQLCTIVGIAFKTYTDPDRVTHQRGGVKYPHTSNWYSTPITPIQAYYIGYRVVNEGTTHWRPEYVGYPGYPEYNPKRYHTLWLFVSGERGIPFLAFPDKVLLYNAALVSNGNR